MVKLIKTVRKTTRPSVDIPFYKWSDSFISFVEENYVNTKKLLEYTIELSEDKLIETRRSLWIGLTEFQDFLNSPEASDVWVAREDYQYENNITSDILASPIKLQSPEEIPTNLTINLRNQF
jgi:hypothetical protein